MPAAAMSSAICSSSKVSRPATEGGVTPEGANQVSQG